MNPQNLSQGMEILEKKENDEVPCENINFIYKAFGIINDQQNSYIIHWSKSGQSFIIESIDEFEKIILPKYFRHNRYQSFVRQLNMYDFHKIRNGEHYSENKAEFKHQNFMRGGYDQLGEIKRKGFKQKQIDTSNNTKNHRKMSKKKTLKKSKNIKKEKKNKNQLKNKSKIPIKSAKSKLSEDKMEFEEEENSFQNNSFEDRIEEDSFSIAIPRKVIQSLVDSEQFENLLNLIIKEFPLSHFVNKLSNRIKLAQFIKQKWEEKFNGRINELHDIQAKKTAYFRIKKHLVENQFKNQTMEDKQNCLADIGEEQNLVNSIFKIDIKSTLMNINSQTFLNHQHNRTFLGI